MKTKKSLIVEHDFFGENSFVFGVFGSERGLQANHGTVRKSTICPQPGNQKRIKVIPLKLFYYQTFFETWDNQHS